MDETMTKTEEFTLIQFFEQAIRSGKLIVQRGRCWQIDVQGVTHD